MDANSEAKLDLVHPELARRVRNLAQQCEANGVLIEVTQGLRTWSQQYALYAQGRTAAGKIVTQAKGGYSAHNFGYAVDIVPNDPAFPRFVADWNGMDARWKSVLLQGRACGLAEGAQWRTFPDEPHLYLQELPATPTDEMRQTFLDGGLDAVWAELQIASAVQDAAAT